MTVIVGTDGTDCGTMAVRWAAREAQRRHTAVRIVHAYDWDWHESRFDIGNEYIDVTRTLAGAVAAAAQTCARQTAPDLAVESEAITGDAYPELLTLSRGAELLVVGSRGRGGFAGLLLGSVSHRLAAHAACPVVVVRGPERSDGPIAAGVSDSPAADNVLQAAFEAAAERDGRLVAIRSFRPDVPLWLANVLPCNRSPEEDTAGRIRLAKQLEPWQAKHPDVPVETVLTYDSTAGALVAASRWSRLVVVEPGTHAASTLQVLHHAECPVLIAHPGEAFR
jgi:nucleotide-binding universal stress UspA family protein